MKNLFLVAALLTLLALPARAETPREFAAPSQANIMKAMVRSGALDPNDPAVLADYLLLNECDLYRENYQDDFRMHKIEAAVEKVFAQDRATWPDAFAFDTPLQLDTYDFGRNSFVLKRDSQLKNVNSFVLMQQDQDVCMPGTQLQRAPRRASVHLDQPVTLDGLPLPASAGDALLHRMQAAGDEKRQIFARFKFTVNYMPPVNYSDPRGIKDGSVGLYSFDGALQSIEFYEDKALTKPIYIYTR